MKNILSKFTWFEWLMLLTVIVFSVYFFLTDDVNTIVYLLIDMVAAISGMFCVVLCAKGKKSQYIFGVVNVVGYIIVAFLNKYYGEVMLNFLYYLPSQFIGYSLWKKHQNKEANKVVVRRLNLRKSILLLMICSLGIVGYKMVLDILGGNSTLLDSASTIISVVANSLMLLRYREQWLLWIVIDAITVVMWILVGDYIMVTMWLVYLINAFNGYYSWTKMVKE